TNIDLKCHHCGDECDSTDIRYDDHLFCCNGCKMVYDILKQNGMSSYYVFEQHPGVSQKIKRPQAYDFLDEEDIAERLLSFREGTISRITLHLPQIHCSSCLWLLENLSQFNKSITHSRVNFVSKEASIQFNNDEISLRTLVELLSKIGYEPRLNLDKLQSSKSSKQYDKLLLYKLGLAGFAFGNIMLLSFPEYLGFKQASFRMYIGYINIVLALPVLLFSGIDYLKTAWKGLQYKNLNIDVPVALGMITLFSRSVYEILSHTGEGYLDSFSGFVFFLLIGKWFQSYTYQSLDFDRNYKSYFPISAVVKSGKEWITKTLDKLAPGDVILVRNEELIPADALVINGKARVDYSFVTGESEIIHKETDEQVLAGGRQMGNNLELRVLKRVDQSYLTQLWNEDIFKQEQESSSGRLISGISTYFTYIVIAIASVTFVYWIQYDIGLAFNAFTAVLIVACPCALALAIPFTYGNILRLLSEDGLYLRNVRTIEDIQDIDHVIFDKTGTITDNTSIQLEYRGVQLSDTQKSLIKSSCLHSSHPLSKAIVRHFKNVTVYEIDRYQDFIGLGFITKSRDHQLKLGSSAFLFDTKEKQNEKGVFIEIDGAYLGYFHFEHALRKGIPDIIQGLSKDLDLSMISGDSISELERMELLFTKPDQLRFNQSPKDKLNYVRKLQDSGHSVMMIGDGLNDSGALKQSDVGIVISDEANNFSPACDGIIAASIFDRFLKLLRYLSKARWIIYGAFGLAFMYNVIGLGFAVTGNLSPVVAAILMPLSSITVIVYGVGLSYLVYRSTMKRNHYKP
ncbi:MAG: heavy metal translocating P-type ATPase metal-binding domain-containing protein, partial [Bacteroidia bacterium]|nr:heavy metal translocating P-type ATPase metal-binding domain-containing protein [Bacteroidia bacterium]